MKRRRPAAFPHFFFAALRKGQLGELLNHLEQLHRDVEALQRAVEDLQALAARRRPGRAAAAGRANGATTSPEP